MIGAERRSLVHRILPPMRIRPTHAAPPRASGDRPISWSGCALATAAVGGIEQRLAVDALARHVREPALLHLLGALVEAAIAASSSTIISLPDAIVASLPGFSTLVPDRADLARDRGAGIGIDDRLQIVRQALVAAPCS